MGLLQIAASFAAAILVGVLARGAWRTYLLLALSVLAVYWFQPAIPIRSLDFWLPSLTLVLVLLTWLVISPAGAWRARPNSLALLIIIGVASFVDLSRYLFPNPIFSSSPPRITLYIAFLIAVTIFSPFSCT